MNQFFLLNFLMFGSSFALAYVKEIDRLERDEDPNESGKRLVAIAIGALVLSFLFALISADAGLIMLTLSILMLAVLSGIAAGHWWAWRVYCKRNPDLFEEE